MNKRNVKSKKTDQTSVLTRIAESCSSGDDESMNVNSHQDISPKVRTSRRVATDPQSTYAKVNPIHKSAATYIYHLQHICFRFLQYFKTDPSYYIFEPHRKEERK